MKLVLFYYQELHIYSYSEERKKEKKTESNEVILKMKVNGG